MTESNTKVAVGQPVHVIDTGSYGRTPVRIFTSGIVTKITPGRVNPNRALVDLASGVCYASHPAVKPQGRGLQYVLIDTAEPETIATDFRDHKAQIRAALKTLGSRPSWVRYLLDGSYRRYLRQAGQLSMQNAEGLESMVEDGK